MVKQILQHASPVVTSEGVAYRAETWGESQPDGTWIGYLEFHPLTSPRLILRTKRETTQPSREALVYWATGLKPVYLEGALARAKRRG
jgi:hypothetical protein